MVAAVILHSSAAASSQFGVTLEGPKAQPAHAASSAEPRVVARTPRKPERGGRIDKVLGCPDDPKALVQRA